MLVELRYEEEGLDEGTIIMLIYIVYIAYNIYYNTIMLVKKKSDKDLN